VTEQLHQSGPSVDAQEQGLIDQLMQHFSHHDPRLGDCRGWRTTDPHVVRHASSLAGVQSLPLVWDR